MRKILTLLTLTLIFNSCSSDDSSNEPSLPNLLKTEQRSYFNNNLEEVIITNFNGKKIVSESFYDPNNQLVAKTVWGYSNNMLSNIKTFSPSNVLNSEFNLTYNSAGRLSQTNSVEGTYTTTTTFTYNGNTILSERNSNGYITNKTFTLNSNGIIDKEYENGELLISIIFNNFNPVSKTIHGSFGSTYNLTYTSTGISPYSFQDIFGATPTNTQLFQNNSIFDSSNMLANQLLQTVTSTNFNMNKVYTFNSNNQPLTAKTYRNNVLSNEVTFYYE
jgi:antitoxin component YwqK of YwqJK toxin-antitoxin module